MDRSNDRIGAMPAPPPTNTRSLSYPSQGEYAERAGHVEPVAHLQPGVEEVREQPVRVHLDDELQPARFPAGGVGHRKRAGGVGAGNRDVDVLAGKEPQLGRLHQTQDQVAQVVGDPLDRGDLGHRLLDRQAGADHVLVVVDQFDGHVL